MRDVCARYWLPARARPPSPQSRLAAAAVTRLQGGLPLHAVRVRVSSGGARPAMPSEGMPGLRPCGGVTSSLGDARSTGCASRERGGGGAAVWGRERLWGSGCGMGLLAGLGCGSWGLAGSRGHLGRPSGALKAWARFGGRLWLGAGGSGGLAGLRAARGCLLGCSCWTRGRGSGSGTRPGVCMPDGVRSRPRVLLQDCFFLRTLS